MIEAIPVERKHTGAMPAFINAGHILSMATNRSRTDELWSTLEYYYLLKKSRDEFLRAKGLGKVRVNQVGKAFESYMTQARNFFTYATGSDYRSAALLYYYAFLNLAKAKIVIEQPKLTEAEFSHGLSSGINNNNLANLTIKENSTNSRREAAFKHLFELRFKEPPPKAFEPNIKELIAYCSDVEVEYTKVCSASSITCPVRYQIAIDSNARKSWGLLAVYDWGRLNNFPEALKSFEKEFEKIAIQPLTRQFTFNIEPFNARNYTFFQSKTQFDFIGTNGVDTTSTDELIKKVLGNKLQHEFYNSNNGFQIIAPLAGEPEIPMDELIATYIIMFRLSEIVRYKPQLFDDTFSSRTPEGWLLKNFIETAPSTFLYRMASWITGEHIFLETR